MGDDNTVTVWVRRLQSEDGTAVNNIDDVEVDVGGKNISALKKAFFSTYDPMSLSRIQFYTPPIKCGWRQLGKERSA